MANFTVAYLFQLRDDFSAKARKLARESQNAKKSVHGLGSVFNSMEARANAAGAAIGRLAHRMRALRTVGRGIGTGGLMGLAGGGYTLLRGAKTIFTFEDAMNQVQGLMGASAAQRKAMEAEAMRVASVSRYTGTDAANALVEMARAGIKANDAMKMLAPTLQLAGAAGIETGKATDILTNIAKTFGYDMSKLTNVGDMLTQAFSNTNFSISEVADSIKYAGPIANAFKIPLEEVTGLLMGLAQRGIKGSTGGTGLARLIEGVLSPSKAAVGALKNVGISDPAKFYDKATQQFDLLGMVRAFKAAREAHGTFKTGQAIFKAFGKRGGRILATLLDVPIEDLNRYIDLLRNAKGRMAEMEKIRMQGLPGAWWKLVAAIEAMVLAIGKAGLSADLQAIAGWIRSLVAGFQSLSPETQKMVGRIALAAGAFSALVIPLGILAMAGSALVPVFGALAGGLSVMARFAALPFFAGLGAAVGYMTRLTAAFLQFGPVATGVLAVTARVITGFTAIGLAIYYWKELSQVVMGFFSGLSSAYAGSELQTAVSWLTSAMSGIATAVGQITGISFEGSGLQSFFNAGKAAAQALLNPITSIQKALGWIGGKLGIVGQAQAVAGKMSINPNTARKWVSSTHAAAQRHQSGPHPYMNNTPIAPVARQSVDVKVTAPPAIEIKYNGPITGPGQINVGARNRGDTSTSSAETETP